MWELIRSFDERPSFWRPILSVVAFPWVAGRAVLVAVLGFLALSQRAERMRKEEEMYGPDHHSFS